MACPPPAAVKLLVYRLSLLETKEVPDGEWKCRFPTLLGKYAQTLQIFSLRERGRERERERERERKKEREREKERERDRERTNAKEKEWARRGEIEAYIYVQCPGLSTTLRCAVLFLFLVLSLPGPCLLYWGLSLLLLAAQVVQESFCLRWCLEIVRAVPFGDP